MRENKRVCRDSLRQTRFINMRFRRFVLRKGTPGSGVGIDDCLDPGFNQCGQFHSL